MSYTGYGDDFMRRVPEGRSEALGQAMDHLRMVPKEIYECPERLVRVFVVANEVCYERGIWAWDIAAGSLILEEAGGKVTDYRGGPLDLEGREIVASNGALHPVLVGITGGNRC